MNPSKVIHTDDVIKGVARIESGPLVKSEQFSESDYVFRITCSICFRKQQQQQQQKSSFPLLRNEAIQLP